MIANQELSAKLADLTKWTTLYWWNFEHPNTTGSNGKSGNPRWVLGNKNTGGSSIPAYNFDYLFEKLRPAIKLQDDKEILATFKLLLDAANPADSLCRLAIMLVSAGLIK